MKNLEKHSFRIGGITSIVALLLTTPLAQLQNVAARGSAALPPSQTSVKGWSSNGPEGEIRSLAIDPGNPNVIYAGSSSAVFKSIDGGASWSSTNLTGTAPRVLVIDPTDSNTVYAMTTHDVFKSTDGGETWSPFDNGLPSQRYLSDLVIDPGKPNVLFAAIDMTGYDEVVNGGVFKSVNEGESWRMVSGPVAFDGRGNISGGVLAVKLLIAPSNPNIIYAAGPYDHWGDVGFFRSVDGGGAWFTASTDIPFDYIGPQAVDLKSPNNIYTGSLWASAKGVSKSTDYGYSWSEIGIISNSDISTLLVDPVNPQTLYLGTLGSGLFKSTDGGAGWSEFNVGLTNLYINALVIDSLGTHLHAATRAGVFNYPTPTDIPIPRIISASVEGKKLIVVGESFDDHAVILINGEAQRTTNDGQNPQNILIGRKAGRQIKSGDKLQVRNPNGLTSEQFIFTGS